MKNSFSKLGFVIQVLFITNVWIALYTNVLPFLNARFPPLVQQSFLLLPSKPEPFEIPLYLILTFIFVIFIWASFKLSIRLFKIPQILQIPILVLLTLIFLKTLGHYPLAGEYDPYPPRLNSSIYLTVSFLYLTITGLLIIASRYLKKTYALGLIFIVIALVTFDARFPMAGHDYEFFIGPSYEVAQGKTIYTDILSRYSFFTPLIFAFFNKLGLFPLSYIPSVVWFLYIAQYLLCFVIIKKISQSSLFAVLGTFSLMTVNYFSLSHLPSVIPQVGPLRWFPIILLLFFFYKLKDFESKKFIVMTAFLSFFMIDVGIAILMAYGTTLFILLLQSSINLKRMIRAVTLLGISLISIILIVDILHLTLGYKSVNILTSLYSFRKHAVFGLSMMPIAAKNYFWLTILIYFASVIYFFRSNYQSGWQSWKDSHQRAEFFQPAAGSSTGGKETTDRIHFEYLLLFSANLSLFASVYFVGRSHPHNLFNIALFPLLTLFLLIGIVYKTISSCKKKAFLLFILFFLLVSLPAFQRRITLTEMILTKYARITGGKIFQPEIDELITAKYSQDIKLIKNYLPNNETIILSADDTYLFYASGKKNLLDANPILGIDLPEDLDFAVKKAIKKCPQKIAVDCSFVDKCPPYTPFTGVNFNIRLLLNKIESGCQVKYEPTICTNKLCIAEKNK